MVAGVHGAFWMTTEDLQSFGPRAGPGSGMGGGPEAGHVSGAGAQSPAAAP